MPVILFIIYLENGGVLEKSSKHSFLNLYMRKTKIIKIIRLPVKVSNRTIKRFMKLIYCRDSLIETV